MRLDRILFLDIETVPEYRNYAELPKNRKYFWSRRARKILNKSLEDISTDELETTYFERAGIYAEFAKIVCISAGFFQVSDGNIRDFRCKSFASHDEKELLEAFKDLLDGYFNDPKIHALCGHNIREFDVPVTCRRMLINKIPFPKLLDVRMKKPWELTHLIDTMELWKFGDWKNYTSLDLLAHIFDVPSSKDDIDGSLVGRVYWEEEDLERIVRYCEKDVSTTAQVWAALNLVDVSGAFSQEEE